MLMGAVTGAVVGGLQAVVLTRQRISGAAWWAVANPPAWALAWLVSSYVITANIDERFTNFGASGCLLYALLTGLLLELMFRRTEAQAHTALSIDRAELVLRCDPRQPRRPAAVTAARGHSGTGSRRYPPMSTITVAGILLLALPVAFNVSFGVLAATFDYPDILRRPTPEVLARFRQGGTKLLLWWWIFALTAAALAPLAVLVARALDDASGTLLILGATVGVLAALVQLLGLIRWPFLIPYLARVDADPDASPARREAVDIVFQSFHRYLGVAVGEHLGYLLTGTWTILVGVAFTQTTVAPGWLGIPGIIIGAVLALCSLEFVGPAERSGWKLAATLTPITYIAWSLWLVADGITLLI